MSENKNDIFKWFVLVLLLVVIGVDFYCFIIPASIGHGMVYAALLLVLFGMAGVLLGINNCYSNNSIQRIRIDKYSYDYLGTNHHDVQISYYPYINIADEIIYK